MDPLQDLQQASEVIDLLLQQFLSSSGFRISYHLETHPRQTPSITVRFEGEDIAHLLARNAELLLSLEHVAAKALRLDSSQHDRISFDAGHFKITRERTLERAAERALEQVRNSSRPFHFPPMNSRERRLLHLALASSGFTTQSEDEGPHRHLVLHPFPNG